MATNFGTPFPTTGFVAYNFCCMIASDTLFDSSGGFSESSYPMKTYGSRDRASKDCCHGNQFWE